MNLELLFTCFINFLVICVAVGQTVNNKTVTFVQFQGRPSKQASEILESPRVLNRGGWGPWHFCPNFSYVYGMNLKVESKSKGDNSGLNAVKFECGSLEDRDLSLYPDDNHTISSLQGTDGEWRGWSHCKGSLATGFQLRAVGEKKCGEGDNVGPTDLKIYCAGGSRNWELRGGILEMGTWKERRECSKGSAICGLRTQIDPHKNKTMLAVFKKCAFDNTGLNNIDVACCKLPRPLDTCTPDTQNIWTDEMGCGEKLACRKVFRKGVFYSKSTSKSEFETTEENRSLKKSGEGNVKLMQTKFEAQIGASKIQGVNVAEVLSEMSEDEEMVEVDMSRCRGRMQQMVLKCGVIQAKTGMFRCLEGDKILSVKGELTKIIPTTTPIST